MQTDVAVTVPTASQKTGPREAAAPRARAWATWKGALALLPGVFALRMVCLIAVWVALTAIGLRLVRGWERGESSWRDWMLLWFVVGVGFLLKQSVLLFLPSFAVYWLLAKRRPSLDIRWLAQQVVGVVLFCVI